MNRHFISAVLIASTLAVLAAAQSRPQQTPRLALESLTGRDSFELYCASCHGAAGTGKGPVAAELRTPPADLTTLTRRSGGVFPRQRIAAFIDGSGRQVPAHGDGGMPVWGAIFRGLDSDARTKVRLNNLVAYVESLQAGGDAASQPSTSPRMTGAQLFRAYCATCHGSSARGDGVLVGQLRRMPSDLTKYTARNGGVFPSERLRRIIDGRDVAAHGDRSMPVWGNVFSRPDAGPATERIDALVAFLESIQERPAE